MLQINTDSKAQEKLNNKNMTSENFHLPFLLKPALSHITRLMSHNMKPYICWDVGCELEVSWILNAFEA